MIIQLPGRRVQVSPYAVWHWPRVTVATAICSWQTGHAIACGDFGISRVWAASAAHAVKRVALVIGNAV